MIDRSLAALRDHLASLRFASLCNVHARQTAPTSLAHDVRSKSAVTVPARVPRLCHCIAVAELIAAVGVDVHDVRPVLPGGAPEQRQHGHVEASEVPRIVELEEDHSNDGEEVEEDYENNSNVAD